MKKKIKYVIVAATLFLLAILTIIMLNKDCMAHYFLEKMMGNEYPKVSNYHKVTVDEMNGTTDKDKEQKVKKLMLKNKINGVVLFGDATKSPNAVECGQNNVSPQMMITSKVLYPIASLQKVYTGIAIQKLINEGKIGLTTTINKFYPNIAYSNKITIEDLLSHRSGIHDGNHQSLTTLKDEQSELSFVEKNLISTGKVGEWNYSDSDYALLAGIVSKISGMSYENYISRKILVPYGLRNTKFYNQINDKNEVISGNIENTGNELCFKNLKRKMSVAFGAGGMFSTANDYWNFVKDLTDNKFIPLNNITSSSNNYYDGVYVGQGTIHADGSMNGCQSCFITNYDSNQTFIFFANNISFKQMLKVRAKLADICFE